MKRRAVIIGIDGVPFGLLDSLSETQVMPWVGQLKTEGILQPMRSSVPEVSSVSWSSIITGKNPGEHNVFGFTDMIPGTYTLSFPHFGKLRAPPFWQNQGEFCIINVPSTYPAAALNGFLVSGFISPDLERAVYPPEHVNTLQEFNYKIDVDTRKARKYPNVLFKELFETLESRKKVYQYFWDRLDWDVMMVVFTGSDRLEHFLWDAYTDESHEYHTKFLEFFTKIDDAIKDIFQRLSKKDSVIMVSDHGMEQVSYNFNVNAFLEKEGFLIRGKDPKRGYNNIQKGTTAFALDPGRIYVNTSKYPLGDVQPEHTESVLSELKNVFESLKKDGIPVIKNVWKKEDVYHGEYIKNAPDLVLLPNTGFNLKGGILPDSVFSTGELSGKHTYEDAFLYVRDADVSIPEDVSVEDVVPVLHQLMEWSHDND
jgi:predicted AlkP superfamily phosphohydrolase/phosphomutase